MGPVIGIEMRESRSAYLVHAGEGQAVVNGQEDFGGDDRGQDAGKDHHPELRPTQEHLSWVAEDRDRGLERGEQGHRHWEQGQRLVSCLELPVVHLLLAILCTEIEIACKGRCSRQTITGRPFLTTTV